MLFWLLRRNVPLIVPWLDVKVKINSKYEGKPSYHSLVDDISNRSKLERIETGVNKACVIGNVCVLSV